MRTERVECGARMKEENRPVRGGFLEELNLRNFDCVRAFRALTDFKAYLVSFAKLFERDADELFAVEEKVLFLPLALDEAEATISETSNDTLVHCRCVLLNQAAAGVEARSSPLGSAPVDKYTLSYRYFIVKYHDTHTLELLSCLEVLFQ